MMKPHLDIKVKAQDSYVAPIMGLSVSERLQIIEEIWESIVSNPETLELTQAQTRELDRRVDAHKKNPQLGASWREVKRKIKHSHA